MLTTNTPVEAQTQVPAVTGVSVQSGANAGGLDVSWDAHPDGADDYRVSWAPQGENFRTWTNTNWNAYPTGTSRNITGLESGTAYKTERRPNTIGGHGNESEGTDSDGNEQQTFSNYGCDEH